MRERPILFSAPMVRAILNGTKTQTRRVVKPQPYLDEMGNACWNGSNFGQSADKVPHFRQLASPIPSSKTGRVHCPYGQPGDRLWVRETWTCVHGVPDADGVPHRDDFVRYRADAGPAEKLIDDIKCWHPSIHMPRVYSRITLEITGVRVERLGDISDVDATAEGVEGHYIEDGWYWRNYSLSDADAAVSPMLTSAKESFRSLWESINGSDSWAANPWVWVIEFNAIKGASE